MLSHCTVPVRAENNQRLTFTVLTWSLKCIIKPFRTGVWEDWEKEKEKEKEKVKVKVVFKAFSLVCLLIGKKKTKKKTVTFLLEDKVRVWP